MLNIEQKFPESPLKYTSLLSKAMEYIVILVILALPRSTTELQELADKERPVSLEFGQTKSSYIKHSANMSSLKTGFTVCSWIKKLFKKGDPTWFNYAVDTQTDEIQLTDQGTRITLFGNEAGISALPFSYAAVPTGTWFHNCLTWDSESEVRYVYINGKLVNKLATRPGRVLQLGGVVILGVCKSWVDEGMDNLSVFGGGMFKLNIFSR